MFQKLKAEYGKHLISGKLLYIKNRTNNVKGLNKTGVTFKFSYLKKN